MTPPSIGWSRAAARGDDPAVIARLRSGWAVMGQRRCCAATVCCCRIPSCRISTRSSARRATGSWRTRPARRAVLAATGALRINYAIFGNLEPALHAHVHPRYADEPEAMRTSNPWAYDWSRAPAFDERAHGPLRDSIRRAAATECAKLAVWASRGDRAQAPASTSGSFDSLRQRGTAPTFRKSE